MSKNFKILQYDVSIEGFSLITSKEFKGIVNTPRIELSYNHCIVF